MFSWTKHLVEPTTHRTRTVRNRPNARPWIETLEDRITPATTLATPTILDPSAAVRVDQASYLLRGTLAEPAKNGTAIQVYRDSNQNGVYNAGVDALVATTTVPKKGTAFSVSVGLQQ